MKGDLSLMFFASTLAMFLLQECLSSMLFTEFWIIILYWTTVLRYLLELIYLNIYIYFEFWSQYVV